MLRKTMDRLAGMRDWYLQCIEAEKQRGGRRLPPPVDSAMMPWSDKMLSSW